MKLKTLLQIVEAGPGPRPDTSGIRGKGVERKPISAADNYPYDRQITYGQPGGASDRGSNSAATSGGHQITPKDDETFSLTLMDLEEMMSEIMGSPILQSRGGSSELGSSVPGMGGEWANDPVRSWDDEDSMQDVNDAPNPEYGFEYMSSMMDQNSIENQLVDPKKYAQMDFHLISPDPWSALNARMSAPHRAGMLPQQSAWDRVSGMTREPRQNSES